MKLIETNKGYIAGSELTGNPGQPRSGHWTVRIPVPNFQPFLDAVTALGDVQRNRTDAQDVTDEYTDLEARIRNKQVLEDRLKEIAKARTEKMAELLEVERELSRVRGEIEQAQGRLQMLGKLSALTTVNVTIREVKDYVPPSPPTAPGFGSEVERVWARSLEVLTGFGKSLALLAVALTPWLPVIAVLLAATWLLSRRLWRASRSAPVVVSPSETQPPV
jgi:hypothetical protein